MSTIISQIIWFHDVSSGYACFILGVVGNILNLLIFTQVKIFQTNRNVFYLIVEAFSDIIYLVFYMSLTMTKLLYGNDLLGSSLIKCRIRYICGQMFALITFYTIVISAIDQFFSTNHNPYLRQICTVKLAHFGIIAIISFWIVHSILFSLFFNIVSEACILSDPIGIVYSSYVFYPILLCLLPIVIASFFSGLAYYNVRHIIRRQIAIERRQFDQQITAMVLVRVILYVCLTLPYAILRIYTINTDANSSTSMQRSLLSLFQSIVYSAYTFNFSLNFYVFILISPGYRRQVKLFLRRTGWIRLKQCCVMSRNEIHPIHQTSTISADLT